MKLCLLSSVTFCTICSVIADWLCAVCRYIPAEVLKGDLTDLQKADVFMLGITLYELATNAELPTGEFYATTIIQHLIS